VNTLKESERLISKKLIDQLFTDGKSFYSTHLRISFKTGLFDFIYPAQLLVSVSKKKFVNAIDRNTLKRKIRESYRLNKFEIYDILSKQKEKVMIAITYNSDEDLNFHEINTQVNYLLHKIFICLQNDKDSKHISDLKN
jgi:ribonuclease P protein component